MALLALTISACATRSTVVLRHDLATRSVCCATFTEMKFSQLGTDEVDVSLGSGSPIFTFDEGKSYFAAFKLPDNDRVPGLMFRSYLSGTFFPDVSVFMPSFVFLDASRKPISVASDVQMHKGGENMWSGIFYTGEVRIPATAEYVVVYTTDRPHQPLSATAENGMVWPVPSNLSGQMKIAVSR